MRHGKTINHLGRMAAHRVALLQNLAVSLIMNKRINTTVAKAKALRRFVEPIITRSKDDSMHNRRTAFACLQDKHAVKELFATVGDKVANRPGGYTRIIRTGFRLGDAAEMCMIELVDFNELMLADTQSRKTKTRRSRSGKKSQGTGSTSSPASVNDATSTLAATAVAATAVASTDEAEIFEDTRLDSDDTSSGVETENVVEAEMPDAVSTDNPGHTDVDSGDSGSDEASCDSGSADASTDSPAD
ncbi:MAG: 50S ribosomal protein L17 [Sphingomonadales bacterium]|nr:50S ribosomal protein L17 [Sphingomonadales bacterium]